MDRMGVSPMVFSLAILALDFFLRRPNYQTHRHQHHQFSSMLSCPNKNLKKTHENLLPHVFCPNEGSPAPYTGLGVEVFSARAIAS